MPSPPLGFFDEPFFLVFSSFFNTLQPFFFASAASSLFPRRPPPVSYYWWDFFCARARFLKTRLLTTSFPSSLEGFVMKNWYSPKWTWKYFFRQF